MSFFLVGHFEFFLSNFLFLFFSNENDIGFHMRYHFFFLYYGWFLQNLRKDFIRTNMHTTVPYGAKEKVISDTVILASMKILYNPAAGALFYEAKSYIWAG